MFAVAAVLVVAMVAVVAPLGCGRRRRLGAVRIVAHPMLPRPVYVAGASSCGGRGGVVSSGVRRPVALGHNCVLEVGEKGLRAPPAAAQGAQQPPPERVERRLVRVAARVAQRSERADGGQAVLLVEEAGGVLDARAL